MKGLYCILVAGLVTMSLAVTGCTPGAPMAATAAPATTAAPAAPVATAAPTKAAGFPEKGKAITLNVPYAAGGATDIDSRVLGDLWGRELGVPVQIMNKPGASSQIGMTEAATAKPDGYTVVAIVLPGGVVPYLDPERKATYTHKGFISLGNQWYTPSSISVLSESPYKSVKDLVDAAKAKPGQVKIGSSGASSSSGLAYLQFASVASVQFAGVYFDGGAPALTALQGGHIDALFESVTVLTPHVKAGRVRVLGITDRQESSLAPGVPTLESQGFPVFLSVYGGLAVPAGTPKEIVDVLSATLKKTVESDEHKKKMAELGQGQMYMTPEEFDKLWTEQESAVQPLIPLMKAK